MPSLKKKIIVNSIVGLVFFAILIWAGLALSRPTQTKTSDNQTTIETDEWSRIKKSKQITIGLDDTFVPMGFRDKNGK
ncbi:MAG: amino acid ABC transporter substrate-binding protein, partial [Leuconostoc falkenbergense]